MNRFIPLVALTISLSMCSRPQSGPDKTVTGAILGAGWGAGTGAVVGNQIGSTGSGAVAGAGLGLVAGAITGAGYDVSEGVQLDQERSLESMKIQNELNAQRLAKLQAHLDRHDASASNNAIYQVYFDSDVSSLKPGAIADLETVANNFKSSTSSRQIVVVGHSDDAGTPEYSERIAEARARAVSGYLAGQGLSMDNIVVKQFGSQRPVASNATPEGRQLNRRVEIYLTR